MPTWKQKLKVSQTTVMGDFQTTAVLQLRQIIFRL